MRFFLKLFFIHLIFFVIFFQACDILIFSKNRPLQLATLLCSIKKHVKGFNKIYILGRYTTKEFLDGYERVKELFPFIEFVWQEKENDFFDKVNRLIFFGSKSEKIILAVDDLIIQGDIDLDLCKHAMDLADGYVLLFTLGQNITHIGWKKKVKQPHFCHVIDDIFSWKVSPRTKGSWEWVNQTDFALYRKKDIKKDWNKVFARFSYLKKQHPQELEGLWHSHGSRMGKIGLSYKTSKVYNLALNKVCHGSGCYSLSISPDYLLKKFMDGYIIDSSDIESIVKNAAHTKVKNPRFVKYKELL